VAGAADQYHYVCGELPDFIDSFFAGKKISPVKALRFE